MPAWTLHPYVPVYLVQKGALQVTKTEIWIPTQLENPLPTIYPDYEIGWHSDVTELVGMANQFWV